MDKPRQFIVQVIQTYHTLWKKVEGAPILIEDQAHEELLEHFHCDCFRTRLLLSVLVLILVKHLVFNLLLVSTFTSSRASLACCHHTSSSDGCCHLHDLRALQSPTQQTEYFLTILIRQVGMLKHAWFRVPSSHLHKFYKGYISADFPSQQVSYSFLQSLNLTFVYLTRICDFCSAILCPAGSMSINRA